jgi:AcrR family transcriptional regulator
MLRDQRKQLLKDEIFRMALKLFKEKGYENVTVEEITSACGIAKGTFFNYFAKKEHILLYLGESQLELLESSIVKNQHIIDVKLRIESIFADLLSIYIHQEELMKYLLVEMVKSAIIINEESKSIKILQDTLALLIKEAKSQKQFTSKWDSELISSVIIGVYFQTLMNWTILQKGEQDIFTVFQAQYNLIWEGIKSD